MKFCIKCSQYKEELEFNKCDKNHDKYVDDVYLGYRLKFHKVKKKLRKLIYYIFKW